MFRTHLVVGLLDNKQLMRKSLFLLMSGIVFLALFFSGNIQSAGNYNNGSIDSKTYIAEVKVPPDAPNSPTLQTELMQQGLKDVLVRLSGSDKILESPRVTGALSKIDYFVKQFSYEEPKEGGRILKVRFNEMPVNELVRSSGFSISVAQGPKPSVLIWFVISENNMFHWVGGEYQPAVAAQITAAAKRFNIPVVFPMYDLTDTNAISEQTIEKQDIEALMKGSDRYDADVILVGKINKQPAGWYAEWTIAGDFEPISYDITDGELSTLINEGIEELNSELGKLQSQGTFLGERTKPSRDSQASQAPQASEGIIQETGPASPATSATPASPAAKNANATTPLTTQEADALLSSGSNMAIAESMPQVSDSKAHRRELSMSSTSSTSTTSASAGDHAANRDEIEAFAGKPADLRIGVSGITGMEQYAKIVNYLRKLPSVTNVEVAEVTPHQTIFSLETSSSGAEIHKHITKDPLLIESNDPSNQDTNLLKYKVANGM